MNLSTVSTHFLLCNGNSCTKNGAESVTESMRSTIKSCQLHTQIHTTKTLCNGQCKKGPIVIEYPKGVWYQQMTPELAVDLIQAKRDQKPFIKNRLYTYVNDCFRVEK
ncbi:hypothetical protein AJ85_08065 [Alkalihalobacillus alcalophilus ATCC 27647 = CGMCC 1.3604]|uniref:Cobalamin biosynthesis protein n=1 Tax=Alkalihalobacillus alcalophilus ATCC 27647 = CGMCC 1.3604 TaxID=1218173 RepID=A0A094YVJ2_ALKAL|nr:(2Fe-2S) ferredoxin domain-containing protein [Alkalihalobacillus alcalophilus]KGA97537.1 hypothetical protein BALCAV_0209800 [Alkalihalobacillus alcalophilus ATCC 27647 = CGMCC 1.3604]MED1560791.1 (2Fe-2S) ferredoxin domain-containing protein [Alkalihalobacillus alcalophilus]THG90943.1 hypothetical protein AJ85_08065 [Alkalihalobacillus alcalophilus ATCC 27647 = CGMCC 1.3604]